MVTVVAVPSRRWLRVGIPVLLLAVIVAGVGLWAWGRMDSQADGRRGARGGAVAVQLVDVARTTVRDLRTFTGTLHARAAFNVAPKLGGRLASLSVDLGDGVTRGQIVARLDDDELVQQVQQAEAELGVAQAALAEAQGLLKVRENQLRRSRELYQKGIGAEAALETAQADVISQQGKVQVAQAQVNQRQAALRAAQVRLSYTVIRTDWSDGGPRRIVGERFANEGDMLAANQPILSVLDIAEVTAVVFATETDYALLQPGQPVTVVADALPDARFTGHIARMAPQFQEESRQARLEVTVANPERLLKPGMYARVEVEVSRTDEAAVVPLESVVSRNGEKGVFTVEGEPAAARFVPVRTGLVQQERVQVLEPALDGRVVRLGQHLLQDGTPVRIAKGSAGEAPERAAGPAAAKEGNPAPRR